MLLQDFLSEQDSSRAGGVSHEHVGSSDPFVTLSPFAALLAVASVVIAALGFRFFKRSGDHLPAPIKTVEPEDEAARLSEE